MGLDTVELVLDVEDAFDIVLPDTVAAELVSVGALHEYVVAELTRLGRPGVKRDIVYDLLRNLISIRLGVPPTAVVPDARFVQDLGAD